MYNILIIQVADKKMQEFLRIWSSLDYKMSQEGCCSFLFVCNMQSV